MASADHRAQRCRCNRASGTRARLLYCSLYQAGVWVFMVSSTHRFRGWTSWLIMNTNSSSHSAEPILHRTVPTTERLLRLKQIMGDPNAQPPVPPIIPISRSKWLQGVRDGELPKPIRLGRRVTVWRYDDVMALTCSASPPPHER